VLPSDGVGLRSEATLITLKRVTSLRRCVSEREDMARRSNSRQFISYRLSDQMQAAPHRLPNNGVSPC